MGCFPLLSSIDQRPVSYFSVEYLKFPAEISCVSISNISGYNLSEVGSAPKKSVPHRAPPHRKKPVPHRAPPHRRPVRKYFRTSAPAIFSENLFLWITTQPTGLEKCMTPQIDREFHEESNDAIDNTVSLMDDD